MSFLNPNDARADHRRSPKGDALGALAGLFGVGLTYGFVIVASHSADPEDSPKRIALALIDNEARAEFATQLGLLAALLLLVFVARLCGALRRAGGSSWYPSIALLGGSAIIAALLFEIGIVLAQTSTGAFRESPQVAQVLVQLSWNSAALYAPGFVALMFGTTATDFRARVFPAPLKWVGVVLLFVMALIVVLMQAPGLATMPGSAWVIVTSIAMALQSRSVGRHGDEAIS